MGQLSEQGLAYVALLVLLAILSTLGFAFLFKVGVETSATEMRTTSMQAHYLAEAAANHAMWRLLNEPTSAVEIRVSHNDDDAEEEDAGDIALDRDRLELGKRKYGGVRFLNVNIPQGATIANVYVQFNAKHSHNEPTDLTIRGDDTDDASRFSANNGNISARAQTAASITWNGIPEWTADDFYRTPDLTSIIQEIVDRPGWGEGNAIAITFESTDPGGKRCVTSRDGSTAKAPLLYIEYGAADLAAGNKYKMHALAGGRYGYKVRRHTDTTFAAIATVGAVGEAVVHQSYVLHIKPERYMITGTYVGDYSDNRAITGIGFQPDVVIVKGDVTETAVIRTATMTGDNSKLMVGNQALDNNMIQSLDGDGFTVGSRVEVNKTGVEYYWAAFKANEGLMKVDTYIGNGSSDRVISGMGFDPKLIMVMSEDSQEVVHRSPYSSHSFNFENNVGLSNCLTEPVPSDGFRVGSDNRVNQSGSAYHYVCWPSVDGRQKFDGYLSSGGDDVNITGLGFRPEYVIVRCVSGGQNTVHHFASQGDSVDKSQFFSNQNSAGNRIQALQSDGFQIGSDGDVNTSGESYGYFAWAGDS